MGRIKKIKESDYYLPLDINQGDLLLLTVMKARSKEIIGTYYKEQGKDVNWKKLMKSSPDLDEKKTP